MVASAVWGAIIIPLAILSSSFLSIPGAFGAGYFWLPQIMMVSGVVFFGPWGMLAAAVGTFLGGMFAGSPLAINIGQNPIPAFLGNTFLFYILWFGYKYKVHIWEGYSNGLAIKVVGGERRPTAEVNWSRVAVTGIVFALTIVFAVVVGFKLGPYLDAMGLKAWGYPLIFLLTLPWWWVIKQLGGLRVDGYIVLALIAVIVSSIASAALGAFAWQTVGGMGASAWVVVFPGWALGDIVAGSLGIPLIWSFADVLERKGMLWRPLR
ncbi:MAG TPA: hypothetical protein VMY36_03610 [Patescibacteria group bacterium]|nr:hypothetical protein [Patescibacteria group bacterium]